MPKLFRKKFLIPICLLILALGVGLTRPWPTTKDTLVSEVKAQSPRNVTFGYDKNWGAQDPVTSPYGGNIYYIATNGSNSNNGLSTDSPWATFAKANRVVKHGDIVYIRSGVYYEDVLIGGSSQYAYSQGTQSAPITWRSYPGEWAIIDGSRTSGNNLFRVYYVKYNIFKNFEVRNSGREGISLIAAYDNVFDNLYTHDNHGSGQTGGRSYRNYFLFITARDNVLGGTADGMGQSSGGHNHYENCLVEHNSDDGIDLWESTYNTIDMCVSINNGYDGGDGSAFKLGGRNTGGGNVVRNSIAANGNRAGFDGGTMSSGNFPNKIYNSIAYNNKRYGFWNYGIRNIWRNNVAYGNGSPEIRFSDPADDKYNSWNSAGGGFAGVNVTAADFQSLDINNLETTFLRLASGSDLIDAGIDVGLPYSGSAPDLGAFEYGGVVQPTPTPTPTPQPNPYDLSDDGQVNGADVLILLNNWINGSQGDFNSDGKVNSLDFGLLIANWD